jgi:hypothetical protein
MNPCPPLTGANKIPHGINSRRLGGFAEGFDFNGADGGGRTHTLSRVPDFESGASANSATSATNQIKRFIARAAPALARWSLRCDVNRASHPGQTTLPQKREEHFPIAGKRHSLPNMPHLPSKVTSGNRLGKAKSQTASTSPHHVPASAACPAVRPMIFNSGCPSFRVSARSNRRRRSAQSTPAGQQSRHASNARPQCGP